MTMSPYALCQLQVLPVQELAVHWLFGLPLLSRELLVCRIWSGPLRSAIRFRSPALNAFRNACW
jgi:hypothetical protein